MRVVSWNLWWRFGGNWRERERGIVATLAQAEPDVAGLQEVWADGDTSQADVLAARLGLHAAFDAPSLPPPPRPPEAPDQAGIHLGVAVLSRWPIARQAVHRRRASQRPAAAPMPTPAPVALVATIDHPAGPLHVVTACIEWEPAFAGDQLAQARALAALVTDPALDGDLPVLLAADLNAAPDTPPARALTDVMVDAWAERGDGDGATLSSDNPYAPREAEQQIDRRIDYVLARPGRAGHRVTVTRAFLAGAPVAGRHPSDHYAVVADLR